MSLPALVFAGFVQDSLTNTVGVKVVYLFGITTFGIAMTLTVLFPTVIILNVCAAISGVGFAVATTIPGTLVSNPYSKPVRMVIFKSLVNLKCCKA